ncbi:MAG: aminodeoxychorismate/anthranilate synthase component II [Polyangiaceae bacterium]|nr:aminodeoxychorismate/anthranilate synthase component II [Polyangiaceae bacterium]
MKRVVLLDNQDSFTHNLAEAIRRAGAGVHVLRNSAPADVVIARAEADQGVLVLSPGPGRPESAGCLFDVVRRAKGRIGTLGICLGHQAILAEAGAPIVSAGEIVHGRASVIEHDGQGPFTGLQTPLRVGRYHSLAAHVVPTGYVVHARVGSIVMAVSHAAAKQIGLQFHPESILTPEGDRILRRAIEVLS